MPYEIPDSGLNPGISDGKMRCFWGASPEDYEAYHDDEWGLPVEDDIKLFEKLSLEGFQSGLSWLTILRKRENFRSAFAGFDFRKVARFDQGDVDRLLGDTGIVRHRKKIESTINNAKRSLELLEEFDSLGAYFWGFEPESASRPKTCDIKTLLTLTSTPESTALAKDLKKRGFSFVGPTTAYAFMQAMGIVNDHVEGCAYREQVELARVVFVRPTG